MRVDGRYSGIVLMAGALAALACPSACSSTTVGGSPADGGPDGKGGSAAARNSPDGASGTGGIGTGGGATGGDSGGAAGAGTGGAAGGSGTGGTMAGDAGTSCTVSAECDDDNDCTEDRCEAEQCFHYPENAPGVSCDDKNPCTSNDLCVPDEGRCAGDPVCDDNDPCTHTDRCTAAGVCLGTQYSCPASSNQYALSAICDGVGGCSCPWGYGRLCVPPQDPSSGCFPQCCPGEPDRPNTCGSPQTLTSRCGDDGVLICVVP